MRHLWKLVRQQAPHNPEIGETTDKLLTVAGAAELLGTSERFPRRLIAERRIRFVRVGRHVRIPESAVLEFVSAGVVEPRCPVKGSGR
ncbi:MAG: helix-turn-helix domain-containing protein [Dermatophilaceae bacterium]